MENYRLSWEMVSTTHMKHFSNADPMTHSNTTQTVPNSQIPNEYWHPITKETNDPWDQYNQLKEWADADTEFVRNVKLEKQVTDPQWIPVEA